MRKLAALLLTCLIAAPAVAGEVARPRLVAGGTDWAQPEPRTELFARGGFSAGTVAGAAPAGTERMALGGYAAYAIRDVQLSSSLKGDAQASKADLSAAYTGGSGVTALTLGYDWSRPQAFSVNPAQAGLSGADTVRTGSDLSLTLSFTRDVTPSLSLGGFAAASKGEGEGREYESGLRFGAGLGMRF